MFLSSAVNIDGEFIPLSVRYATVCQYYMHTNRMLVAVGNLAVVSQRLTDEPGELARSGTGSNVLDHLIHRQPSMVKPKAKFTDCVCIYVRPYTLKLHVLVKTGCPSTYTKIAYFPSVPNCSFVSVVTGSDVAVYNGQLLRQMGLNFKTSLGDRLNHTHLGLFVQEELEAAWHACQVAKCQPRHNNLQRIACFFIKQNANDSYLATTTR